jgi:glycosyltransferase involved in cell wall biosynthesis
MNRLPISVCMVSGAEADRIGRALESVAGWTSEIIVVLNAEVADRTEEVAGRYGAKVVREPWKGYLAQKNSAAEKCGQPWAFNLDADEVVSPELRQELLALFANSPALESCVALSCPRLSHFCGRWIRHGDWYPDRLTRLWRRGQARWSGMDPHPYIKVDGKVAKLKGALLHFSSDSITNRLGKIVHFSDEFVRQHTADRTPGPFDLAVRPLWRFLRAYFLRLGFLDGWQGFYIASHTAFSTLVRYAKLREARLAQTTPTPEKQPAAKSQ